ncbi:class II aldolase/adducin family protein [Leptotrichia wadei]|uniref:class II aldolase/adducin family protein n=1 Tax=Leptotrichia wadei TaxID=157687 RepID=UPI0028EBBE15|nr:class II aldolase/adducin family protein [Leptotrichia wadei]
MNEIKNLIKLSKYAGMREDIIQAGGGNTSVKINDETMFIKSSGYQLSEMEENVGYSKVNYKKIVDYFKSHLEIKRSDEKELLENTLIQGKRPSIETFLHSITEKYTLHTHPLLINVFTSRKNGMKELKSMFPNSLIIDYQTPGIFLAKEFFDKFSKLENPQKANIVFLKNHGLIVSGKNMDEVIELHESILETLENKLKVNMQAYRNSTFLFKKLEDFIENNIVYLCENRRIKNFIENNSIKDVNYCFSPDSLIYCNKKILLLNKNDDMLEVVKNHNLKYGNFNVVYFENELYIIAPNVKKAKEIESVLSFNLQVLKLNKNDEMDFLTEEEQNFLLNWDSEKYRKNL